MGDENAEKTTLEAQGEKVNGSESDVFETIEEEQGELEKSLENKPEEQVETQVETAPETNKSSVQGLDDFVNDFKKPSQTFEQNDKFFEKPKEEGGRKEKEISDVTEVEEVKATSEELKRKAGKGIFLTVNGLFTTGAGFIADEPTSKFKLDKETKSEIEEGFIELSDAYGWEKGLPSWVPLTVLIVTAYGSMMYKAYGIRKEKQAEAKKKKALKSKIIDLTRHKKVVNPTPKINIENPLENKVKNPIANKDLDVNSIKINTDFQAPKKKGRGAYTAFEKEQKKHIKMLQSELLKAKEYQAVLIDA